MNKFLEVVKSAGICLATVGQLAYFYLLKIRLDDRLNRPYIFIEKQPATGSRQIQAIIHARLSGFWLNKLRILEPAELNGQIVPKKNFIHVTSDVGEPRLTNDKELDQLLAQWDCKWVWGFFGNIIPIAVDAAWISFKGIHFLDHQPDFPRPFARIKR